MCAGYANGQNALYDGLDSCIELVPGELNMHYKVLDNGTLDMALEGLVFEGNAYLSFGFAAPSARSSKMVGGTAVVAGTAGDACFALDYYLGGEVECNFATGTGSCPSSLSSENGVKPYPVELVACERDGDALAVRFRRPLGQIGEEGYWPVDGSQYAMYAVGLVGDGSNTEKPEVLDHYLETEGSLVIKLDVPENSCATILASGNPLDTSSGGSIVASPMPGSDAEQVTTKPTIPVNVEEPVQYGNDDDDDDDEGEAEGEAGRHDDDDDDDHDDDGEGEAGASRDNMVGADRTSGNSIGTALSCQMEVDGEVYPFQICDLVGGIGSNFYLAWNISAAPNDPGSTLLTMGMNSTMSQQYIEDPRNFKPSYLYSIGLSERHQPAFCKICFDRHSWRTIHESMDIFIFHLQEHTCISKEAPSACKPAQVGTLRTYISPSATASRFQRKIKL